MPQEFIVLIFVQPGININVQSVIRYLGETIAVYIDCAGFIRFSKDIIRISGIRVSIGDFIREPFSRRAKKRKFKPLDRYLADILFPHVFPFVIIGRIEHVFDFNTKNRCVKADPFGKNIADTGFILGKCFRFQCVGVFSGI